MYCVMDLTSIKFDTQLLFSTNTPAPHEHFLLVVM